MFSLANHEGQCRFQVTSRKELFEQTADFPSSLQDDLVTPLADDVILLRPSSRILTDARTAQQDPDIFIRMVSQSNVATCSVSTREENSVIDLKDGELVRGAVSLATRSEFRLASADFVSGVELSLAAVAGSPRLCLVWDERAEVLGSSRGAEAFPPDADDSGGSSVGTGPSSGDEQELSCKGISSSDDSAGLSGSSPRPGPTVFSADDVRKHKHLYVTVYSPTGAGPGAFTLVARSPGDKVVSELEDGMLETGELAAGTPTRVYRVPSRSSIRLWTTAGDLVACVRPGGDGAVRSKESDKEATQTPEEVQAEAAKDAAKEAEGLTKTANESGGECLQTASGSGRHFLSFDLDGGAFLGHRTVLLELRAVGDEGASFSVFSQQGNEVTIREGQLVQDRLCEDERSRQRLFKFFLSTSSVWGDKLQISLERFGRTPAKKGEAEKTVRTSLDAEQNPIAEGAAGQVLEERSNGEVKEGDLSPFQLEAFVLDSNGDRVTLLDTTRREEHGVATLDVDNPLTLQQAQRRWVQVAVTCVGPAVPGQPAGPPPASAPLASSSPRAGGAADELGVEYTSSSILPGYSVGGGLGYSLQVKTIFYDSPDWDKASELMVGQQPQLASLKSAEELAVYRVDFGSAKKGGPEKPPNAGVIGTVLAEVEGAVLGTALNEGPKLNARVRLCAGNVDAAPRKSSGGRAWQERESGTMRVEVSPGSPHLAVRALTDDVKYQVDVPDEIAGAGKDKDDGSSSSTKDLLDLGYDGATLSFLPAPNVLKSAADAVAESAGVLANVQVTGLFGRMFGAGGGRSGTTEESAAKDARVPPRYVLAFVDHEQSDQVDHSPPSKDSPWSSSRGYYHPETLCGMRYMLSQLTGDTAMLTDPDARPSGSLGAGTDSVLDSGGASRRLDATGSATYYDVQGLSSSFPEIPGIDLRLIQENYLGDPETARGLAAGKNKINLPVSPPDFASYSVHLMAHTEALQFLYHPTTFAPPAGGAIAQLAEKLVSVLPSVPHLPSFGSSSGTTSSASGSSHLRLTEAASGNTNTDGSLLPYFLFLAVVFVCYTRFFKQSRRSLGSVAGLRSGLTSASGRNAGTSTFELSPVQEQGNTAWAREVGVSGDPLDPGYMSFDDCDHSGSTYQVASGRPAEGTSGGFGPHGGSSRSGAGLLASRGEQEYQPGGEANALTETLKGLGPGGILPGRSSRTSSWGGSAGGSSSWGVSAAGSGGSGTTNGLQSAFGAPGGGHAGGRSDGGLKSGGGGYVPPSLDFGFATENDLLSPTRTRRAPLLP